jgi:DNA-binding transcriptional MerR regulator
MSETNVTSRLCQKLRPVMSFPPIEAGRAMAIGQTAAHLGVTLRTLRFYEQSGLLAPVRDGQRRVYSVEDVERLEIIVTLRELELSLAAIRELFRLIDEPTPEGAASAEAQIGETLDALLSDNVARIAELQAINQRISVARGELDGM